MLFDTVNFSVRLHKYIGISGFEEKKLLPPSYQVRMVNVHRSQIENQFEITAYFSLHEAITYVCGSR